MKCDTRMWAEEEKETIIKPEWKNPKRVPLKQAGITS